MDRVLAVLKKIWKPVFIAVWKEVRPIIEEKVQATESKWDDGALAAVDLLVDKFVGEEEVTE